MLPEYAFIPEAAVRADNDLLPTKTYRFDPETGKIGGFCDGTDAMRQAICKRLTTPRGHFPIYPSSYGSALWQLRGCGIDYVTAMLPTYVRTALLEDDRVRRVDGFSFEAVGDRLSCSFTVHTVYGSCEVTVQTQP